MGRKKKNPDITKAEFLEKLRENRGNQYKTYTELGLPYTRYYNWLQTDEAFKAEVEKAVQIAVNFAESKLGDAIANGNMRAIEFFLRCKGGYSDKRQIEVKTDSTIDVNAAIESIKQDLQE